MYGTGYAAIPLTPLVTSACGLTPALALPPCSPFGAIGPAIAGMIAADEVSELIELRRGFMGQYNAPKDYHKYGLRRLLKFRGKWISARAVISEDGFINPGPARLPESIVDFWLSLFVMTLAREGRTTVSARFAGAIQQSIHAGYIRKGSIPRSRAYVKQVANAHIKEEKDPLPQCVATETLVNLMSGFCGPPGHRFTPAYFAGCQQALSDIGNIFILLLANSGILRQRTLMAIQQNPKDPMEHLIIDRDLRTSKDKLVGEAMQHIRMTLRRPVKQLRAKGRPDATRKIELLHAPEIMWAQNMEPIPSVAAVFGLVLEIHNLSKFRFDIPIQTLSRAGHRLGNITTSKHRYWLIDAAKRYGIEPYIALTLPSSLRTTNMTSVASMIANPYMCANIVGHKSIQTLPGNYFNPTANEVQKALGILHDGRMGARFSTPTGLTSPRRN